MSQRHIRVQSHSTLFPNKENSNSLHNIINTNLPTLIPPIKRIKNKNSARDSKQLKDAKNMQNSLQNYSFKDSSLLITKQDKNDKANRRKKTYLHLQSKKITSHNSNNNNNNITQPQKDKEKQKDKVKQIIKMPLSGRINHSLNRVVVNQMKAKTARNRTSLNLDKSKDVIHSISINQNVNKKSDDKNIDVLKNHKITQKMRAKMIDWIIQVLSAYSYGDDTFFLAVNTMDNYFLHCNRSLPSQDLHIVGVACIYLAVKYEEVYALKLKTVYDEIAHKKLLKNKILQREGDILNTISFVLIKNGIFQNYQTQINYILKNHELSDRDEQIFKKNSIYLLKMLTFENQFYLNKCPQKLAKAVIFTSIRLSNLDHVQNELQKTLMKSLKMDSMSEILQLGNQVYQKFINFQKKFSDFKNLERNHGQHIYMKDAKISLESCII